MLRHVRLLAAFVAFAVAAVLSAACMSDSSNSEAPGAGGKRSPLGDPTAAEAVTASGDHIAGMSSYLMLISVDGPLSMEGEEAFVSNAIAYSRLEMTDDKETAAVLFIPPDLYTQRPDGTWYVLSPWHQGIRPERLSALTDDDALGPDDAFLDYGRLARLVRDANQMPDDSIDGDTMIVIGGKVELSRLWPDAPPGAADVTLWLHPGNFVPRRVEIGPIDDGPGETTLTFDFVGYNETATVPARPPNAQPFRDLQIGETACTGAELAGCLAAQSGLNSTASASCDGSGRRVCIVPLGQVSVDLLKHLVDHYQKEYGLTVTVLTPVAVPPALVNAQRGQVDGDQVIDHMEASFPAAAADLEVVLIGLTPVDVYDAESHVRYYFGKRGDYSNPSGVISTFRMNPAIYGEPGGEDLFYSRVRKMLTKYLGLLYYGLPPSSDPSSPMFDSIGGPADLDAMTEPLDVP